MSFLLNSSTSSVMDRFWRLLLELPKLLVTLFYTRISHCHCKYSPQRPYRDKCKYWVIIQYDLLVLSNTLKVPFIGVRNGPWQSCDLALEISQSTHTLPKVDSSLKQGHPHIPTNKPTDANTLPTARMPISSVESLASSRAQCQGARKLIEAEYCSYQHSISSKIM